MIYTVEVNGVPRKIEASSMAEAIETAELWERGGQAPVQPTLGTPGDMFVSGMMGGSLGFFDEIGGLIGGDPARDAIRWRYEQAKERSPVMSTGAEFLGGVLLPGGLAYKAMRAIPGMTSLGALTSAGGLEGGIAGAGYSRGEIPGQIAADAALGAATGAVLAPLVGYTTSALGQAGLALLRKIRSSPQTDARKLVTEALRDDQLTPDQALTVLREIGDEAAMADVGPNLQSLAGTAYRIPGPGRTRAREFLTERAAGAGERIGNISAEELGPQWRDYNQLLDTITIGRRAQSEPLYAEAFSQAVRPTRAMADALNTPAGQTAMRNAQEALANDLSLQWRAGNEMTADGRISVRFLDQVKKSLDDMIGPAMKEARKDRASKLITIKRALTNDLDTQVPVYAQARNVYSGAKDLEEALGRGRSILRESKVFADDLQRDIRDYTEGEMDAMRVGFFRGILDQVETTRGAGDASRRVLKDQRVKDIAKLMFRDEDSFQRFVDRLSGERAMAETAYQIMGNSATAGRNVADQATAARLGVAADLATGAATGSVYPFLSGLANVVRKTEGVTPEIADELSKMLFDKSVDPRLWRRLERAMMPFGERMEVGPRVGLGAAVPATEMMVAP